MRTDALLQVAHHARSAKRTVAQYVRRYGQLGDASMPVALACLRTLAKGRGMKRRRRSTGALALTSR